MVKKIDIHFYHGFLGNSQDWDPVIQSLTGDYNIWTNDLTKTFFQSFSGLKADESYLERWGKCETLLWGGKHCKRILVGYSMGGRLLMHIDPSQYDAMILLSSHPGLKEGREKRIQSDKKTSAKISTSSWGDWLTAWNAQNVFKNDNARPDRSKQGEKKLHWAKILEACSLGSQNIKDGFLHENKEKVTWVCGSEDLKYYALKSRMEEILGAEKVLVLEGAGHGLLFEDPKQIAGIVEKVVGNVE